MPSSTPPISPSQSVRLSTAGTVLISISSVLGLVVVAAILVVYRRRRSTAHPRDVEHGFSSGGTNQESSWKSIWILSRRNRTHSKSLSSNDWRSKHTRKRSTATFASSAHDGDDQLTSNVVRPLGPTITRVPQQWFLQGSPREEITDPLGNQHAHHPASSHKNHRNLTITVDEYHKHHYNGSYHTPSPMNHSRRTSMGTTLVQQQQKSPYDASFQGADQRLAPSVGGGYPFTAASSSRPDSPMFYRDQLSPGPEASEDDECHSIANRVIQGREKRYTFGYDLPSPIGDVHPAYSPTRTEQAPSAARQVQVQYQQQQSQRARGPETQSDHHTRPTNIMTRQASEAPSLAISVPRSVSPTSPRIVQEEDDEEEEEEHLEQISVRSSPQRPRLLREQTYLNVSDSSGPNTPSILVSSAPPTVTLQVPEQSYFSSHGERRRGSDQSPGVQSNAAVIPSPGLHTAFRSAFFLDAGPDRGIAMSSMPQTPAVEY
ncbi:unnamed protein product [Sympodiomycopsis kandeliae]